MRIISVALTHSLLDVISAVLSVLFGAIPEQISWGAACYKHDAEAELVLSLPSVNCFLSFICIFI